jgi:hypothetical protein
MSYTTLNNTMDAIKGQIENQLGSELDSVVIFDGDLPVAVEQHFNTSGVGKSMVFIGAPTSAPDRLNGCGLPLRQDHLIDIYVVVRADGRTRYTSDRERLFDLSDAIVFDVFECANRTTDFTETVHGVEYVRSTRIEQVGAALLARRHEFNMTPAR